MWFESSAISKVQPPARNTASPLLPTQSVPALFTCVRLCPPVPQVTPESLLLHYYSSRPGLWPIVVGVLKGMSKEYFGFEVGVELVASRDAGDDHEVFRLSYPYQEQLRNYGGDQAGADAATYAMPPPLFYRLFPFHLLLAEDLTVLQSGPGIKRIAPALKEGDDFVRHFKVCRLQGTRGSNAYSPGQPACMQRGLECMASHLTGRLAAPFASLH